MGKRQQPPALKRLGQHFLGDPGILRRIANAACEGEEVSTLIEVGAGRGALTEVLAPRVERLVAIEIDRALAELLRDRFASSPRVEVLEADALDVSFAELAANKPFAVVGNVPYYITSPLIFHSLARPRPVRAVLLVQSEVADRLLAQPGTGEYGALTVNVRAVASVELLFHIGRGSFTPRPQVDSTLIRIVPLAQPLIPEAQEHAFSTFVKGLFGKRRKQLGGVLREILGLERDSVVELLASFGQTTATRAESLSPETLAQLFLASGEFRRQR